MTDKELAARLECYRLKANGAIDCKKSDCEFWVSGKEFDMEPYCCYNRLLFEAVQRLNNAEAAKPYYKEKSFATYSGDVITYKKLCCGKCGMEFFANKRIDNNYCSKCGTLIDWEGFEND